MARCLYLIVALILFFGLSFRAEAASYPLIVQVSPTVSIDAIAATLGGTVVDSIPGANTYLLNLPFVPLPTRAIELGIQWMEVNTSVSLPLFTLRGVLSVPGGAAADWYKGQPTIQLIHAGKALTKFLS